MKQVLSREEEEFFWVAFPLVSLFLVDCSIVPHLLNSFGLTCKLFLACLPFSGAVLVFAHLYQDRNGLQRMSLAAV